MRGKRGLGDGNTDRKDNIGPRDDDGLCHGRSERRSESPKGQLFQFTMGIRPAESMDGALVSVVRRDADASYTLVCLQGIRGTFL